MKSQNENETESTRGIRCYEVTGRPSPFLVQFRRDGKAKTESFKTARDRDARARELSGALQKATLGRVLSRADAQAYDAFQASIGAAPWQDVVAGWRSWLTSSGSVPCELTVRAAGTQYLETLQARVLRKEINNRTYLKNRPKVNALIESFGSRRLTELTGKDIEAWVADRVGDGAPGTWNTFVKVTRAFFGEFKAQVPRNPATEVKTRTDSVDHVGILTVAETARLFDYANANARGIIGRLALEAFAGLRTASAALVTLEDIRFDDLGIQLPAAKIKTKRRRYIDSLPAALWEWLKLAPGASWANVDPISYMRAKTQLFIDAKVPHPRNCLRHSFATYHCAGLKDPGLTATILCHTSQEKLWQHYNGIATQEAGKAYLDIRPATAAQAALRGRAPQAA